LILAAGTGLGFWEGGPVCRGIPTRLNGGKVTFQFGVALGQLAGKEVNFQELTCG
jgi:hypothetical protein